ncbi:hypothetical protein EUTSA_v10002215mg [Eutrema salsugineum]|uniref:RING-type domain-containing protein n=1 Tax=Eutrema salsugineum TaxID=72664 RepID=V4M1X3_EUTSA|nr:hypothetical protein EUTSA_v10002215mg [Eutrema salsugineum]
MGDQQNISYSFSYETHLRNTYSSTTIHLIIKRPHTEQNDIIIDIPYARDGFSTSQTTLTQTIESLLTYHEIEETQARRTAAYFVSFLNAVQISHQTDIGTTIDIYFKISDNNYHARSKMDTDTLIANLNTTKRNPTFEDENEDCPICLQTFKGIEDINSLPCNHMYHHQCIVNWLYTTKNCPICRAADF